MAFLKLVAMGALFSTPSPPGKHTVCPACEYEVLDKEGPKRDAYLGKREEPSTARQKAKAARDAVAALTRWKAAGVEGSASEFTPALVEMRLK